MSNLFDLHYRENKYKIQKLHHKTVYCNKLINGAMRVAQRGTSFAIPVSYANNLVTDSNPPNYTLDRWFGLAKASGKVSFSQEDRYSSPAPPPEFSNYLKISTNSSYSMGTNDLFALGQYVEYKDYFDFYWGTETARVAYLSFWVNSSVAGDFGGSISNYSTERDIVYPFKYTINNANTWEHIFIKINPCKVGTWTETTNLDLYFNIGCGSNLQSDTNSDWISGESIFSSSNVTNLIGSNNTFCITGVQLEQNNTPTPYQHVPPSIEILLCQYYYQVLQLDDGDCPLFMTRTDKSDNILNYNKTFGSIHYVTNVRDTPIITFDDITWTISALSAYGNLNNSALTTSGTNNGAQLNNNVVYLDGVTLRVSDSGRSYVGSLGGNITNTAVTLNTTMGSYFANISNVNAKTDKFTLNLTNESANIIFNNLGFCVVWTPIQNVNAYVNAELYPLSLFIESLDNITDDGFTIGGTVTKDMTYDEYTYEFDPYSYQNDFFPGMADFISDNILVGDKNEEDRLIASYWDDLGNDVFDDWGYFYLYDVESGKYYFPLINPLNQDDGDFYTQTFNVFGRTFTIKHGWAVQGIFKFDITVNDNKPFRFGAYGNMGSDGDEVINDLTYVYRTNRTLYYQRHAEDGDSNEILYSYWIPKKISQNASITYDFYNNEDDNNMMSKEITNGLLVYFAKKNDVKEWVANDLT